MSDALVSEGAKVQIGDGASPEVFNDIAEVTDFSGPGGQANVISVTHLQSTFQEKRMGLPDEGQLTLSGNLIPGDTNGQVAARTARKNRTEKNFKVLLSDSPATTLSFAGYVLGFEIGTAVDDKIPVTITIEITGEVTWA